MLMCSVVFVLAVNRKIMPILSSIASSPNSIVLAERIVDLDQDGRPERVVKIKNKNNISIQVYELLENRGTIYTGLAGQYDIQSSEDGFIFYKSVITNLAFADDNADGQVEIIVSFFDKNTKESSFMTLQWDKKQKTLRKMTKE